jgi:repressor LexA
MTTLTQCQQQVLDMLISYQKERGFPPTNQEVATMLGYRSVNAAVEHLRALEKKGVITIKRGVARGITLHTAVKDDDSEAVCLPVRRTPGCVQPTGYMRGA